MDCLCKFTYWYSWSTYKCENDQLILIYTCKSAYYNTITNNTFFKDGSLSCCNWKVFQIKDVSAISNFVTKWSIVGITLFMPCIHMWSKPVDLWKDQHFYFTRLHAIIITINVIPIGILNH